MITNPAIKDMRSEGPLKPTCDLCDRNFRVWDMKRRMPCGHIDTKHKDMDLMCPACTRRTINEAGMDPADLIVDYSPWQQMLKDWEVCRNYPANQCKIRFETKQPPIRETM